MLDPRSLSAGRGGDGLPIPAPSSARPIPALGAHLAVRGLLDPHRYGEREAALAGKRPSQRSPWDASALSESVQPLSMSFEVSDEGVFHGP